MRIKTKILLFGVCALLGGLALTTPAFATLPSFTFNVVRNAALPSGCVPNAGGTVQISDAGPVQVMAVQFTGLVPNTDFDFFVIQVPTAPFGMAWYQGDVESDSSGNGQGVFIGRFSIETFVVAPGVAPAPETFESAPFPSVGQNPQTGPVQMYHLGLWFNSPTDATNNGCPGTVTPFNGEHNAGVQVINTSNFPNDAGPLINVD